MSIQYMIHACPKRMWYVENFMLPRMMAQGIPEEEIMVWNDTEKWGNLKSFIESMRYIKEYFPEDESIWHIQDDVLVADYFYEYTKEHKELAYGFCNDDFDKGYVEDTGIVPVNRCWHSFQCLCIPNKIASEYYDWFQHENNNPANPFKLKPWTKDNMNDDMIFRIFLQEKYINKVCTNVVPNLVDHVDYLIGNTVIHNPRPPRTSAYWTDTKALKDLYKALDKYRKVKPYKGKMYVCYSLTREYYDHLRISLRSLIKNNPKITEIFLLIEDDSLPYDLPKNCTVINISGQDLFPEDYINAGDFHTYACAIRVAHDHFLPDYVDKVLALDCDTIICEDISPLWSIDLDGKWFAAGNEYQSSYRPYGQDAYYNGGVVLHNLDQQRKDNASEEMIRFLLYNRVKYLDEEVLNRYAIRYGKDTEFPVRYNECWCDGYTNDPAIVHFCSVSRWWEEGKPRSKYWREYMEGGDTW